jgi:hypothetical protein
MIKKEVEQNSDKTEKKQEKRGGTQFQKGQSGNPDGRPKGTKNFSTLVDETIKEIAKEKGITVQEAWQILMKKAYNKAIDGDHSFWKEIFDRYYGKPKEKVNIEGDINWKVINYHNEKDSE